MDSMLQNSVSPYLNSWQKRIFDISLGSIFFITTFPAQILIGGIILLTSGRPIIFVQDRAGKDGTIFKMYKFRTMKVGAEKEQEKLQNLNEADGPVFKIRNDPRFTGVGKWLSHAGLDELPQLVNVISGDMSMVGPRPLPVEEYEKIRTLYAWRNTIRPGIVSTWIIKGSHHLGFGDWMQLDKRSFEDSSLTSDISLIFTVGRKILEWII